MTIKRCDWATKNSLEMDYHDKKWGKPLHDERELFKLLILEGQQAGLSWQTILAKWDSLCLAYDNFDPEKIATYDDAKISELIRNPGVIRNKLKIKAVVKNAQAYLRLCQACGSLDAYLWAHVNGEPIINKWEHLSEVPTRTTLSDKISKDLKRRGFSFVGSTTIYAYMQAVGMVNDHLMSCSFR